MLWNKKTRTYLMIMRYERYDEYLRISFDKKKQMKKNEDRE